MATSPQSPFTFPCGLTSKNRFMLAPLTNTQSHQDGQLSEEEFTWLTKRAEGQFGIVMTCASHVQANGKGFPGQLGIFSDIHTPGHQRLASEIRRHGSLALVQLHHAGMRSPEALIGERPVCPSDDEKTGARALSLAEVEQLRDDFIAAAVRAKQCGYDGVEIHGAHGYILCQFLSSEFNHRTDAYGGSLEKRARLLFEIVEEVRKKCGAEFLLGVRLSPERFGMDIAEIKWVCQQLIADGKIDFLDLSLWDCFKLPLEEKYQDQTLLEHFAALDFGKVLFTAAGRIRSGADVHKALDGGLDFITAGQSGILHHDFPKQVINDPDFVPVAKPVSAAYLHGEAVSEKFVDYLRKRPGFILD